MTGAPGQLIGPVLFLVFVLGTDLGLLRDARARAAGGRPVVLEVATLRIDAPGARFVACLLAWVVFVALHLVTRG